MLWRAAEVDPYTSGNYGYILSPARVTKEVLLRSGVVSLLFLVLAITLFWITSEIVHRYIFQESSSPLRKDTSAVSDSDSDDETISILPTQRFHKNLNTSSPYLRRASFAQ